MAPASVFPTKLTVFVYTKFRSQNEISPNSSYQTQQYRTLHQSLVFDLYINFFHFFRTHRLRTIVNLLFLNYDLLVKLMLDIFSI